MRRKTLVALLLAVGAVFAWFVLFALYPEGDCARQNSLVAHPYFGFVLDDRGRCAGHGIDRQGFRSARDIPLQPDPGYFTILWLGGSVADQLSSRSERGATGLERVLNRDYVSPNGKPFRTLSAAVPGWRISQSLAALDHYGNRVDAVISLDGFDEAMHVDDAYLISMPPPADYLYAQRSIYDVPWIGQVVDDGPGGKNYRRLFRFFQLPKDWARDRRQLRNLQEYEKSIRLMKATADALGVRYAHFLQPVPGIQKPLRAYEPFQELSAKLARQGLPAVDLTDVFAGETGTLYSRMSLRIARDLARLWGLKKLQASLTE